MRRSEGRALRLVVLAVVAAGLVLPILAGLWETARAAFGILPAIGAEQFTFGPWVRLVYLPGFATSVVLSLWTGVASTMLALMLAFGLAAFFFGRVRTGRAARVLVPLLAAPHAAMAIGIAFLVAPSGWIARLLSPWATGWSLPPDIATVHDPLGLALILGLLVKEVPFLLLVTLSALTQLPVRDQLAAGRALGYASAAVWIKIIIPQVCRLIRLPIFVTLSFALSVVDMALILGPSNPPTLAVAMTRWFFAADTTLILPAAAASLMLAAIVATALLGWRLLERATALVGRAWLHRGGRGAALDRTVGLIAGIGGSLVALGAMALVSILVWSLSWRWTFPAALPESWSLRAWMRSAAWQDALEQTLVLGGITTVVSIVLAVLWLEGEDRGQLARARWAEGLIYLPLLLPQVAFLYGLSVSFLRAGFSGGMLPVVWGQVLFVFPYVMLALSDPWRSFDPRMDRAAAALGAGPWRRFFRVKLPVLLRPILTAAAIGFAVSVALYLPTIFLGAGRITTLTTEAVTLSSGSDRRVTGVYAVLQSALPFAAYAAALLVPAWLHRHRRGLSGGFA